MSELGRMREEKRALEQQISDLFALKAKHAVVESRKSVSWAFIKTSVHRIVKSSGHEIGKGWIG